MTNKFPIWILIFGFWILVSGCGERIESTYYYYSPAWTRDGKVIFVGQTQSVRKDVLGSQLGSSYTEYVLTIYPAGTGESSALFDATGASPYAMTCSPSREYVAYGDNLQNGLYGKIVIQNIASGTRTGLEKVELLFSPGVKAFDWSNEGTKLVYCTTREVRRIDMDGSNDTRITSEADLEFVTWKYGARIAFVRTSGSNKLLSLIYSDGSNRLDLAAGASVDLPQISSANTNEVYGIAGGSLAKVDVSADTPSTSEEKTSFTGALPRLSPDAAKAVYSKSGESTGVYVLDIAAGSETKIK